MRDVLKPTKLKNLTARSLFNAIKFNNNVFKRVLQ
jgi:hypothetical protein